MKSQYQALEAQIKASHDTMNKLGIKQSIDESQPTHKTSELPASNKSPKELRHLVAQMESRLEAIINERENMEAKNRAVEVAIQSKMGQLQMQLSDNSVRENRFIGLKSRDPFEMKREIASIKGREIELTNRLKSLQNLPMYRNEGGANTLIRIRESEDQLVDLKSQTDAEARKLATNQSETDRLKKLIETLHGDKLGAKKDITRIKAIYEAGIDRQNNNLLRAGINYAPNNSEPSTNPGDEEFNEKLIRTLGLVRWKGEEPAWYKIQFLERARNFNPNDTEGIRGEYVRLNTAKQDISTKLDRIQAQLKLTVDDEKKREDQHLIMKKKKENDLLRAVEQRKDLEATLDRIGAGSGKVFIGKNQRTGDDVYYNDAVSVFSMDKSDLFKVRMEDNLLDLYLDRMDLDSAFARTALEAVGVPGVNTQLMVSLLAVNFFNHPTLTSQKCIGNTPTVAMQCTFSMTVDSFLIEYCKQNSLDVDLYYSNEKGSLSKFALIQIEMKDLLEANLKDKRPDYIGVVNKYSRVYSLGGQHIGTLSYRMKPRMPIYQELANYNLLHVDHTEVPKTAFDIKYLDKNRRLTVKICNGYGFSTTSRVYIVYRVPTCPEITTQAVSGANPKFDEQKVFDLIYSKGLRENLRSNKFEILAFDDSVPFKQTSPQFDATGIRLQDVIGTGLVSLMPLSYDKPIVEKVYLKTSGGKVHGSIFVKIYWEDIPAPDKDFNEYTRAWEDELSRRIINEIKKKGLNMRSVFNLADSDSSKELTKEEFNKVLAEVLGVKLTPRELQEYWGRMTKGAHKDTVSFSQLLTFYGNLLDAGILGTSGSMRKDISDVNKMFRDGSLDKMNPGNADLQTTSRIIQEYSAELRRIMKEQKLNEKQLFDTFDADSNYKISRHEFMACNMDVLKVKTPPRELDAIFDYADKNNSDQVDLAELLRLLNFDQVEYLKSMNKVASASSDLTNPENFTSEQVIFEFLKIVKEYMQSRKLSMYQVYALIDKSKDNMISRAEIKTFIEDKIEVKMPAKHIQMILNAIDKSGDNKVSVKEFVDFMNLEDSLKIINDPQQASYLQNLLVIKALYAIMMEKELTPEDLLLSMDKDGNGSVDYIELGLYVKHLDTKITGVILNDSDVEKFLVFVDKDHSGNISIRELRAVLEAYNKTAEPEVILPKDKLEELLRKVIPIIDQNRERLRLMLETHEDAPGKIKVEIFRKAMTKTCLFTTEELELIINPLCKSFTDYKKINYLSFLDLKKVHPHFSRLKDSGLSSYRGSKLVEQIFTAMKKVGIKHKITNFDLFRCFDIDNSGFLTLKEMRVVVAKADAIFLI